MSGKRSEIEFLSDILEAIHRIRTYTAEMTFDDFLSDWKTQDAVIRNLEIIGEAAKKISNKVQDNYPQIPWSNMARMRDRLIHHYFGVSLDVIWAIITIELEPIASHIEALLQELTNQGD